MTVRINDAKLFKAYSNALKVGAGPVDRTRYFINNFSPKSELLIEEYQLVIGAILKGEDVELYSQKYRVKLNGLVDSFGQQYVTRLKNGDGYFAAGEKKNFEVRDELIQEFTQDEVNYIMRSVIQATVEAVE